MAESQFARPSVDTIIGGYTDQAGGVTNIYQRIDEVVADDADYIRSRTAPVNDPYVTKLSVLLNPQIRTNHIVRYRYGGVVAEGKQLNLTVELREAYVDENNRGALRATWLHANIAEAFTTATSTLTTEEAMDIVDYEDLYLRIVFHEQDEPLP